MARSASFWLMLINSSPATVNTSSDAMTLFTVSRYFGSGAYRKNTDHFSKSVISPTGFFTISPSLDNSTNVTLIASDSCSPVLS